MSVAFCFSSAVGGGFSRSLVITSQLQSFPLDSCFQGEEIEFLQLCCCRQKQALAFGEPIE